jgi:hypothetical protein
MWTPAVIISTHKDNGDYYSKNPQIAVDTVGNSYVVWQGFDGNDQEIYWVKIDADRIPGIVQKISIHPHNITTDDWLPQIAVDTAGNSYVVWSGSDGNDYDIYWVKIDAEGNPGTIQNISDPDTDYDDGSVNIAVDAMGNSYVVWQGFDGNDTDIYWVKIDAAGIPGVIQQISTHKDNATNHDYDPQITIDTLGNSYVVWHGCDKKDCWKEPGDLEIYWVKIDARGTPGVVKKIPPTSPDNIDTTAMIPQIAADPSGNSFIVWSGKNEKSYDIYWVRIDASGNAGAIQRVSAHPNSHYDDVHPETAVDTLGNVYIAWEGSSGNQGEIYWVKIDPSGIPGTVQKVSNYLFSSVYEDWDPQIAVDTLGNSYVTWNSFNGGFAEKFDQQICWIKIDAEGNPGKVHKLSGCQYAKHVDRDSRICAGPEGNSYVIWVGQDASNHDHIYFTAHLPNLVPLLRVILLIGAVVVIAAVLIYRRIGQKAILRQ